MPKLTRLRTLIALSKHSECLNLFDEDRNTRPSTKAYAYGNNPQDHEDVDDIYRRPGGEKEWWLLHAGLSMRSTITSKLRFAWPLAAIHFKDRHWRYNFLQKKKGEG